jgi:hypothetical protein
MVSYIWRLYYLYYLYDLYDRKDFELLERNLRPETVGAKARLAWSISVTRERATVELSKSRDFQNPIRFESNLGETTTEPLRLGDNFWRVSFDGKNWSETQKFVVEGQFLANAQPHLDTTTVKVPLLSGHTAMSIVVIKSSRNGQNQSSSMSSHPSHPRRQNYYGRSEVA